jgi:hypothetical protein
VLRPYSAEQLTFVPSPWYGISVIKMRKSCM